MLTVIIQYKGEKLMQDSKTEDERGQTQNLDRLTFERS